MKKWLIFDALLAITVLALSVETLTRRIVFGQIPGPISPIVAYGVILVNVAVATLAARVLMKRAASAPKPTWDA